MYKLIRIHWINNTINFIFQFDSEQWILKKKNNYILFVRVFTHAD